MATPVGQEYNLKVADYTITFKSVPFVSFLNNCQAQLGVPIAGVVFYPIATNYVINNTNYFHTHGVKITVAGWDNSVPPVIQICPLSDEIYTDLAAINPDPAHLPPSNQPTKIFSQTWELIYTNVLRFYKVTGSFSGGPLHAPAPEFDLVYLDIAKFCELAGITRSTAGVFSMGETGSYYQTPVPEASRGFQISRSGFDFDYFNQVSNSDVELGKARTLKFNPFPVPALMPVMARPAVAYQLGIPCPPIWKNGDTSAALLRIFQASSKMDLVPDKPTLPPDPPAAPAPGFLELFKENAQVRNLALGLVALLLLLLAFLLFKK